MFRKKILAILAATIMVTTIGETVPVMAANTADTTYRVTVESSMGVFKSVLERDKQNNSKVYVNISNSPTL